MTLAFSMPIAWLVRFGWMLLARVHSRQLLEQTVKAVLAVLHHQKNLCGDMCEKKTHALLFAGYQAIHPKPKAASPGCEKRKFTRSFMHIKTLYRARISAFLVVADWKKDG